MFSVQGFSVQGESQGNGYGLAEWEITLRNHKEKDMKVGILEPLSGNWKGIDSTHPYVKTDAFTIRFDVDVPNDGEVKVRYRVQVGL